MKKIRVLIVDDHHIVRMGLITIINDQQEMEVIGEAGNAAEALREVEQLHLERLLRLTKCVMIPVVLVIASGPTELY